MWSEFPKREVVLGVERLPPGLVVHRGPQGPVSTVRIFHAYIKGTLLALVFVSLLHPCNRKFRTKLSLDLVSLDLIQAIKMYLHQYDYIFAIGTLFAMLDAFNNGASE